MNTSQHNPLRRWAGLLAACALAAGLTACGGGDDDGSAASSETTTVVAAPAQNASTGVEQSGNLNYLVTSGSGTRTVPATVAYSAPKGTLTLSPGTADEFRITTTDEWETTTWANQYGGALHANGNAGLVCDGEGGQVGLSHNMKRVNNPLDIVKGKTFAVYECDPGVVDYNVVFNVDGSVLVDEEETLKAEFVSKAFSDAGYTAPDGGNTKLSLYAYTQGEKTSYHLMVMGDAERLDGSRYKWLNLGKQN